jgi:hypothetical protein
LQGTASSPWSALDDCQDTNTVAVLLEDGQASGRRLVDRASTAEALTACVAKGCRLATAAKVDQAARCPLVT